MSLSQEGDHYYYNIEIPHTQSATGKPTNAVFYETRSQPFLDKSSDYVMTVLRFFVPSEKIPLFVLLPTNPNVNLTSMPFSITLTQGAFNNQQYMQFISRSSLPYPPFRPTQPFFTAENQPYFFVYSQGHFLDMLNATIVAASAGIVFPAGVTYPYFTYEADEGHYHFHYQAWWITSRGNAQFWMNNSMFNSFFAPGFSVFYAQDSGTTGVNFGKDYQFILEDPDSPMHTPPLADTVWIDVDQEVITPSTSFQSIVFTSSTIPVRTEGTPNASGGGATNNSTLQIVTDFLPDVDSNFRSSIQFAAQSEFRRIDLLGDSPFGTAVNLNVYWTDNFSNLFPITLVAGESVSVKLGFFRKGSPIPDHVFGKGLEFKRR